MKSALFVRGGWEGHEPEKTASIFASFLKNKGYGVEVSGTLDSCVDIHAVCEDLRTEGVALDREPVVGLDGTWQAWVKDPDGNAIDLMQLS